MIQRVIVKCHGKNCETMVDTTFSHRHDCLCKPCSRSMHLESNRLNRVARRAGANYDGKRGRKPSTDGQPVRSVMCATCGRSLLKCACLDELDMLQRAAALRRFNLTV